MNTVERLILIKNYGDIFLHNAELAAKVKAKIEDETATFAEKIEFMSDLIITALQKEVNLLIK
jgi:hypothetical protein